MGSDVFNLRIWKYHLVWDASQSRFEWHWWGPLGFGKNAHAGNKFVFFFHWYGWPK
jgi:hypothetical protein